VLLTYWAALAFVSRRAALFAGLMMASCLLLSFEGRIAKTDAMLLATVVAAMGAMARIYLPERRRQVAVPIEQRIASLAGVAALTSAFSLGPSNTVVEFDPDRNIDSAAGDAQSALADAHLPIQMEPLTWFPTLNRNNVAVPAIFWTALAVGVLLKGPAIVAFVGLAVLTLTIVDRSARWLLALQPLYGFAWFALLVLPWFVAIGLRSGGSFLSELIGQEFLSKLTSGQETHGALPGYYLVLYWVTFFPGALLTGLAAPAVWAARREPGAQFLLAWVVPAWIALEFAGTKLPHYVLPLYPALAILIAGTMDTRTLSRKRWLVNGTIWWFLIPLLGSLVGLFALFYIGQQLGRLIWPLTGASLVMGMLAWRLYDADGAELALLRAVVATLLLITSLLGLVVPVLTPIFPSMELDKHLRESGCREPVAAAVGYHEPSLVFLAGTATRLTDPAGAAEFLRGGDCRFALIERRQERSFAQRAEAIGLFYSQAAHIEAFNVGSGRTATIVVFRSGGPR
jgi:4-amino-4-deoxy-L-arabinose transferase-like glycosyltransferase